MKTFSLLDFNNGEAPSKEDRPFFTFLNKNFSGVRKKAVYLPRAKRKGIFDTRVIVSFYDTEKTLFAIREMIRTANARQTPFVDRWRTYIAKIEAI